MSSSRSRVLIVTPKARLPGVEDLVEQLRRDGIEVRVADPESFRAADLASWSAGPGTHVVLYVLGEGEGDVSAGVVPPGVGAPAAVAFEASALHREAPEAVASDRRYLMQRDYGALRGWLLGAAVPRAVSDPRPPPRNVKGNSIVVGSGSRVEGSTIVGGDFNDGRGRLPQEPRGGGGWVVAAVLMLVALGVIAWQLGALDGLLGEGGPVTRAGATVEQARTTRMKLPPESVLPADIPSLRYKALLFSAWDYEPSSGIPDLKTPKADVDRLGEVLGETYGFDVEIHHNVTRLELLAELDELAKGDENDAVIVYYAGHGEEFNGNGYWQPSNAGKESGSWVMHQDVLRRIDAAKARHVLVVADSCYSGLLHQRRKKDEVIASLPVAARKTSRKILTSGADAPVLDKGPSGLSVFAYYFTQALEEAEGPFVTVEDVYNDVYRGVYEDTDDRMVVPQEPQLGRMPGDAFGRLVMEKKRR